MCRSWPSWIVLPREANSYYFVNWQMKMPTRVGARTLLGFETLTLCVEHLLKTIRLFCLALLVARQLAFRSRRHDAFLVLKFLLTGYHHSPVLFHNISKDLVPLIVSCRKSPVNKHSGPGAGNGNDLITDFAVTNNNVIRMTGPLRRMCPT